MRSNRDRRRLFAPAGLVALAVWAAAMPAGAAGAARADSTATAAAPRDSTRAAAPRDSTRAAARADSASAAPVDSSAVSPPAAGIPKPARGDIDADRLRFDGRTTPRRQFDARWPAFGFELPFASDAFAMPITLDAGLGLAGWRAHASDRTPVSGLPLFFGPANAATAIARPGGAANDPFLVTSWQTAPARTAMEGAGELLARPRPVLWSEPIFHSAGGGGVTTSALLYEKGAFGDEQAGARFAAPSLGRGLAGAYTRRVSDGEGAYFRATDIRYALAVALPSVAGISGRFEGGLASRRIEGAYVTGDTLVPSGEALLDEGRIGLHLERHRGAWEHALDASASRSGHTSLDVEGARERWKEPSWTIGAASTWRPAAGWTWLADAHVTRRAFQSRVGPANASGGIVSGEFAATRDEGRIALGVRRDAGGPPGARRSWSADIAYDGRDADRGFLDARLGGAVASKRGLAALDLESTHERATWEDRLTPSRDRYFSDVQVLPKPLRYSVAADPDLGPRRLNGGVARAEWRPGASASITASASARYLADDFGWDLTRTETPDSILVDERATRRGSGWVSHASLGGSATWRSVHLQALGWLRGGSLRLSPRAGAPPRVGGEASIDAGATFFRGDLPLRLGLDAHFLGTREAPIRAPAIAILDASLRADFNEAGLFLRIDDLLDRRPPSGAYEIATDGGVPTLGRRFRFGVIWHLTD